MDTNAAPLAADTLESGQQPQVETPDREPPFKPTKKFQRIGMEAQLTILRHHADGLNAREIAKITGIAHQRISEITTKHGSLKQQVQQVLNAQRVNAARAWGRAIPKAAKKGDHRPARELLIATGDVSPLDSTGSGVTVVVNMPGAEAVQGAKVVGSGSTLDNAFVMPSPQVVD